jgi:hypothetical protein
LDCPEAKVMRHLPAEHCSAVEGAVAVQAVPHEPQLFTSVWVSTQLDPQTSRPVRHTHVGAEPVQVLFTWQVRVAFPTRSNPVPHA